MSRTRVSRTWYVYMVRCLSGALYTGIAIDPWDRARKHNEGKGAKAVRALGLPVTLEYFKKIGGKSEALKAEAFIKSLNKERKEKLILISKKDWIGNWPKRKE